MISCTVSTHLYAFTSISINAEIKSFDALDGRQEWLARSRIVNILEHDPVFDKSNR